MTRDEARFLLSAVRADRIDRCDARVAEALRLVEEDPELRGWFEASGRFDRIVAERLAEVSPPAQLRDSILVGMQVSRRSQWPRRGLVLLAAAAVLGFAVFLASQIRPGATSTPDAGGGSFAEFEGDMLDALANLDALDHRSADPAEITAFLREHGVEETPVFGGRDFSPGEAPHVFVGCKVLEWRGYRASLICLRRSGEGEGEGRPDLHLVTVPAEAVADLGRDEIVAHLPDAEGSPRRWSTTMWRSGDLVHLVAVDGRHPDPRRLVPLG